MRLAERSSDPSPRAAAVAGADVDRGLGAALEDETMAQVISESTPRARKHIRCDHCERSIPPGQVYHRAFLKDGGDTWSWSSHMDCKALADAIWKANDYSYDEGICLSEEWANYPDETALWRGDFPHVICRLEFRGQLRA